MGNICIINLRFVINEPNTKQTQTFENLLKWLKVCLLSNIFGILENSKRINQDHCPVTFVIKFRKKWLKSVLV